MEKSANSICDHPVLKQFLTVHAGCDQEKAQLGFLIYMNLCEVRGWRDVEMHYCETLHQPYISGQPTLSAQLELAVPLAMDSTLSHDFIQSLFLHLTVNGQAFDRIMLAICASDSSIVYYKISSGIIKPDPPEDSEARRHRWIQKSMKHKQHIAQCVSSFCQQVKNQDLEPP